MCQKFGTREVPAFIGKLLVLPAKYSAGSYRLRVAAYAGRKVAAVVECLATLISLQGEFRGRQTAFIRVLLSNLPAGHTDTA